MGLNSDASSSQQPVTVAQARPFGLNDPETHVNTLGFDRADTDNHRAPFAHSSRQSTNVGGTETNSGADHHNIDSANERGNCGGRVLVARPRQVDHQQPLEHHPRFFCRGETDAGVANDGSPRPCCRRASSHGKSERSGPYPIDRHDRSAPKATFRKEPGEWFEDRQGAFAGKRQGSDTVGNKTQPSAFVGALILRDVLRCCHQSSIEHLFAFCKSGILSRCAWFTVLSEEIAMQLELTDQAANVIRRKGGTAIVDLLEPYG